tara:strand:+ start:7331 stop:7900 length:570 start_codon:yes stop_codon:yes gene_type:complete
MTDQRGRISPYLKRLYGYAYSLTGNPERAKDLAQDCAVKALSATNVPSDEPAYRSWLFRIMRNQFIDGLRRDKRAAYIFENEPPGLDQLEYSGGDERLFDRVAVRLAYEKLDTRQREILSLLDVVGLSYRETSEVLGIPAGTVMSRISRARGRLLELIEETPACPEQKQTDRKNPPANPDPAAKRANRK